MFALKSVAVAAAFGLVSLTSAYNGEVPHRRSFFYVGGEYVDNGAGTGEHIYHNQMYVEKLEPLGWKRATPVVLMHGQAQTGTNFLNKPDGGRGWASLFLENGYELYIIDQTFRGRSAWEPLAGAEKPSTYSAELLQKRFTAVQDYNLWAQSQLHTQWPGTGVMGDPAFDAFYASNVQFISNATYQQSAVQAAGALLLDKIGKPAFLVGHSQGGLLPLVVADARPQLTKGLILLEPSGPPFQNAVFSTTPSRAWGLVDIPITYDPPVTDPDAELSRKTVEAPAENLSSCVLQADHPAPRKLANLADKPVLILTSEASYHAQYDYCTGDFLKQAGVEDTTYLNLADVGIHGNGHMFFMEKNSDDIFGVVRKWIQNKSGGWWKPRSLSW